MVNLGMFHLLDRAKTAGINAAMTRLLQQAWVVFSCQIQYTARKQLKVSTMQFATADGDVYIFDCIALGPEAVHECGLAYLLQSRSVKKIMYSSDNAAGALWRQLKVHIGGAVDLQALTAAPHQWPTLPAGSDTPLSDAISECGSQISARHAPTQPLLAAPGLRQKYCKSSSQYGSFDSQHFLEQKHSKAVRAGHESPQAVLDMMLDEFELDATSSGPEDDIVCIVPKDGLRAQQSAVTKHCKGRCSSLSSFTLLDSMQLMELPVLPGEDESLIDVYMEHKHDEGERFDWLQRPLPSDAFHYAAAEAKTILQLYQQLRKDNKDPDKTGSCVATTPAATPLPGPCTPYRSQHQDRRRVLSEGLSGKQRSGPAVDKLIAVQKAPAPVPSTMPKLSPVSKGSKKGKSWMSHCLGG